jgi:DnaJ like chaperone protein
LNRLLQFKFIVPIVFAIIGLVIGLLYDFNHLEIYESDDPFMVSRIIPFSLIGIVIGLILMLPIELIRGGKQRGPFTVYDYKTVILPLVIALMKLDGTISRVEELNLKHFIKKYANKGTSFKIFHLYEELKSKEVDLSEVLSELNHSHNIEGKKSLMYLLVNIAVSDRFLAEKEEQFLFNVAVEIDFPKRFLEHFLSQRNFTTSKKHSSQEKSRKKASVKTFSNLELAYKIIGVSASSDADIVKKEYRALVKKFHPDKLVKASQIEKDMASEQFQKIQEAYEYIKDQKGFK